ncbi:hypothetical protein [Oceanobacillus profundus]|nr:hypothetical protein [Oceanobacillus profundus]MBR2246317.1 hypothetical protein [Bacilli bacterium]MBR3119724.1 hypothetical protein [Oceanobacillus sp.]
MKLLKKVFYDEMYTVKLNGAALVGWITASLYGVVSLIKTVISAFN